MAISGTKVASNKTIKNYFVNECKITDAEVMDSQYTDMSLKLQLEDKNNGYTYTCFVNQNFEKDHAGVVTDMKYPTDLNTLFLAAGTDLNVSDAGVLATKSLEGLVDKEVACITYSSTGKYKRNTWGVVSSLSKKDDLESQFIKQLEKGYPKDYQKPTVQTKESDTVVVSGEKVSVDDLPF